MTFSTENFLFLDAVLILASIVISKWGYRFGIPTLLLFLFTGMLFGTDGLGLEFNSHENAQLIGMLSLSVILFSGGMDTKLRDIEPVLGYLGGRAMVMMVKREGNFIVPNGQMEMREGDILLTIAHQGVQEKQP